MSSISYQCLSSAGIKAIFMQLHPAQRPTIAKSFNELSLTLTSAFHTRGKILSSYSEQSLAQLILCHRPFYTEFIISHEHMILDILCYEFGDIAYSFFTHDYNKNVGAQATQQISQELQIKDKKNIIENWPQLPDSTVIMKCLKNYRNATCYPKHHVCVCCGQAWNYAMIHNVTISHDIDICKKLFVSEPFLINRINENLSSDFHYSVASLNGIILCKEGIHEQNDNGHTILSFCHDCYSSLHQNKMPRLALANKLYRGTLPKEFSDITWVEEMVCAISRTTTHVTRLYESTDPKQPFIYHGNSCAHEVNVVSTASVLPRTPGDINSILTVVFVGSGKFDSKRMGSMMKICKNKVWQFLLWLKQNNRLYCNMPLDASLMDLYSDKEEILPGIIDRIIYDSNSDPTQFFES